MLRFIKIIRDTNGDAIVEAAILFPIIIMIFAALVLLAIYLPTRGTLQRATQYAATAIATDSSDAWLCFDERSMSYSWETDKSNLENVYVSLFSGMGDVRSRGEGIVTGIESLGLGSKAGELDVECYVVNRIVYKEVVVAAKREFPLPVDLTFIRFPGTITIAVTSTAVVQNGDEFVRSVDLAADFSEVIAEKFGLTGISDAFGSIIGKASAFLGWK